MKKFTGFVIILAALVLSSYYGMGVLTERTIKKNIEVIDQSNGLYAKINDYHKGLFSSTANVKWRLHVPARVITDPKGQPKVIPAQDYNLEMPFTIFHGPIIFSNNRLHLGLGYAEVSFPFPAEYKAQFDSQFTQDSVQPRLDLSIFVNYVNQSTLDIKVPAFHLIAKDNSGHFEWLGMNASTTMSSNLKKVSGTIALSGLTATKDESKFTVRNVSSNYDLHETSTGMYLGDANFSLPSFDIFAKDKKIVEISDLTIKTDSDIQQHLFKADIKVALKSVLVNEEHFGPGELDFSLRNMDADVLAKIDRQTAVMQNGDDTQRQQTMLALLPEIPKLLSKGAELELSKLDFKIPQGQVEGNLYISWPKENNANPFEIIQKIQGKATLQVPEEAVKEILQQAAILHIAKNPDVQQTLTKQFQESQASNPTVPAHVSAQANQPGPTVEQLAAMQTAKQINALRQSGLITEQGTSYRVEVHLDKGKFIVNGKAFDSSMIKF